METSAPVPEEGTRAARRAAREAAERHPVMPPLAIERRPLVTVSAIVIAGVLGVAAFADHRILAAAVAWAGLVVAWGWPGLLGSSSRFGSTAALALAAIGAPTVVALTRTDPYLRYVPGVVAVALVAMFLHQLMRRDGRPQLTDSIIITAAGLAVLTLAVTLVPLARTLHGSEVLAVAVAGAAAGSLADLLAPSRAMRPWMLPLAMILGAGAAVGTAAALGHPGLAGSALIGLLTAAVAHAMRRVLAGVPAITHWRAQVTSGIASVLAVGVVAYVLGRLLLG